MGSPSEHTEYGTTIVTLTMNSALDVTTSADHVGPTNKIPCRGVHYDDGGGGIDVARIARVLGGSVSAVFPAGGHTRDLVTSGAQVESAGAMR